MAAATAIGLAHAPGLGAAAHRAAIEAAGCRAAAVELGAAPSASALILLADPAAAPPAGAAATLRRALERRMPILAIGGGLAALNAACGGGGAPAPGAFGGGRLFITLGSKLAHIVGGSGWLSIPMPAGPPISQAQLAAPLMASCYDDDAGVHALEHPGHEWAIGIHWDPLSGGHLPRGLDTIVDAFIRHARGAPDAGK